MLDDVEAVLRGKCAENTNGGKPGNRHKLLDVNIWALLEEPLHNKPDAVAGNWPL